MSSNSKLTAEKLLSLLSDEAISYFFPGLAIEPPCSLHEDVLDEVVMTRPVLSEEQILEEDELKRNEVIAELSRIREQYGLSLSQMEALLAYTVSLSSMTITRRAHILLDDYDVEITMDTLSKAVYFLYLRHPEGINQKDMIDYRGELEEIYLSLTDRDDIEPLRKSVADVCDPMKNSLNEKLSRIKSAFRNKIDERIADFYIPQGEKGTARRIPLDRSYVHWD